MPEAPPPAITEAAPELPTPEPVVADTTSPSDWEVVKVWNFKTSDKADWEWFFPGGSPQQTEDGAWYTADRAQTGPMLRNVSLNADDFRGVRVRAFTWSKDEPTVIKDVSLYWSRTTDEKADDGWAFTNARRVYFEREDDSRRNWVARLDQHNAWNGEVDNLFIRFTVTRASHDPDGEEPLERNVFTEKIELLK